MTSLTSSAASTPSPGWVASAMQSAVAGDEAAFARIGRSENGSAGAGGSWTPRALRPSPDTRPVPTVTAGGKL